MIKIVWGLCLVLFCLPVAAGPQNLATIKAYFVDFQSDLDLGECELRLMEELDEALVKTESKPRNAEAIYVVKIEEKKARRVRNTITWTAVVYSLDNRVLHQASAEESGWNATSACYDAAEDIAEELADEIQEARVNRGRMPEPRYAVVPTPSLDTVPVPVPSVAPAPVPVSRSKPASSRYQLKERAIDAGSATQGQPGGSDETTREPSKWRRGAVAFAQLHGCSEGFKSVQPLPSGAEIYVTSCGSTNPAFITCSSNSRCDLSD